MTERENCRDAEATASTEAAAALAAAKTEEADAIEEEKRISSVRVSSNDDRVISALLETFQKMFEVSDVFMSNLTRELSSAKKLRILLVDMDQVKNFDQDPRDVETILKLPMPVFVVGSADVNLAMAATALHNLVVAYGHQEDVDIKTISDDKSFETVTQLLRNAGALSESISREVVAGDLDGIPGMLLEPSTSETKKKEMRTGFNWSQKEFVRG
jgi:hypothetical protein